MKKAKIKGIKSQVISEIDPRLYGSFIEHLGRAVYGGIYEPTHETADDMGFRQDVLDAVKKIQVPLVRYPGGNFVSGYHWQDGIGPRENRPRRLERAWGTIETNEIGIDEFQEWAKRVGTEIMMAVNLGTGTAEEAGDLVEYCNCDTDSVYANKRRTNGFEKPFGIHTWCLGNEMDGDWQICHLTPVDYARKACEAAKVMKWTDPSIELVACGSSGSGMATFGEWEEAVLRGAYDHIDYLSLHSYYGNPENDTAFYLGCSQDMDKFIDTVVSICDKIQKELGKEKQIHLSFDEWNVWFHSNEQDKKQERWQVAPPLLEDVYNLEDALVVGCLLNSLIRHADRVKIGCLAQLINVIAPIMTKNGGGMWMQTIYYPFLNASLYGRGQSMKIDCECDTYTAGNRENISYVDSSMVWDADKNEVTVFVVNRSLDEEIELNVILEEFGEAKLLEHQVLTNDDVKAINTLEDPYHVVPSVSKSVDNTNSQALILEPHSYHMIRYAVD